MHAQIAICMMMVGGYIVPEADIKTIPLNDDLSNLIAIQDKEYRERAQNRVLPRVPTVADPRQAVEDRYGPYAPNAYMPRNPIDQNAYRRQAITEAPTAGGNSGVPNPWQAGQTGQGAMPRMPGAGGNYYNPSPGVSTAGPAGNTYTPNGSSGFANPVATPGFAAGHALGVGAAPTASGYIQANNGSQLASRYGLPPVSNITAGPTAGGGKAFDGYQAPSGNSPWNGLFAPTANGTTNPYTQYVRPAMEQQTFNAHISEQINGVQTQQRYGGGTPYHEMPPPSGPGLVNPAGYIENTYIPH
jgi:hypothetical protein